jgi:hypothetical protein
MSSPVGASRSTPVGKVQRCGEGAGLRRARDRQGGADEDGSGKPSFCFLPWLARDGLGGGATRRVTPLAAGRRARGGDVLGSLAARRQSRRLARVGLEAAHDRIAVGGIVFDQPGRAPGRFGGDQRRAGAAERIIPSLRGRDTVQRFVAGGSLRVGGQEFAGFF